MLKLVAGDLDAESHHCLVEGMLHQGFGCTRTPLTNAR